MFERERNTYKKRQGPYLKTQALTAAVMILASGCASGGKSDQDQLPPGGIKAADAISRDSSRWQRSQFMSPDGLVRLEKREMPQELVEQVRNEYRATDLLQLPIDGKFNVTAFKISNVPEYEGKAFLAPKIFAYGSSDHGRIAPIRNGDGTVSLSFPVILVNGEAASIPDPVGDGQIPLPPQYLIKNYSEFEAKLRSKGLEAAPMPGCPKRIYVVVGDREYDASTKDLAQGDYCNGYSPFSVTIRVPEADARFLLEDALYAGAVDVRAIYETRVSFTVAKYSIEFDRAKVFEDLTSSLGVKSFFYEADLHAKLTEVMKKYSMKVRIVGERSAQIEDLVNQAKQIFFSELRPDPNTDLNECGGKPICFRLNYNYQKDSTKFSVDWAESTTAQTGQNYLTWAKLKPLLDNSVRIGLSDSLEGGHSRPMASNQGSSIETGLTVVPGDLLVIAPEMMTIEERALDLPSTSRSSNNVCVRWDLRRSPYRTESETMACWGRGADRDCDMRGLEKVCVQYEDQWIETTSYSFGTPNFNQVPSPIGYAPQLFEGIYLKFTGAEIGSNGSGASREVTCPLKSFAREGDGKSLTIRIENQPGCEVFKSGVSFFPIVSIENRVNFPQPYKSGRFVKRWNGQVVEVPTDLVYRPRVDLGMTVTIKGMGFGSSGPGGSRLK